MLCVRTKSASNRPSSTACDTDVYCVVCTEPQLAVACIERVGDVGSTLPRMLA